MRTAGEVVLGAGTLAALCANAAGTAAMANSAIATDLFVRLMQGLHWGTSLDAYFSIYTTTKW
jgi:hypothetical protein